MPSSEKKTQTYSVLPLRDIVMFPHMVVPLFVGRDKSVRALEDVMKHDKKILLVAQKDAQADDPGADDIYQTGTVSSILQLLKLPDGNVKVLMEGVSRARILSLDDSAGFFQAETAEVPEEAADPQKAEAASRAVLTMFEHYIKLSKKAPPELLNSVSDVDDPGTLADTIAAHINVNIADRQKLLETGDVIERLQTIYAAMEGEISVLQVERKIRGRVKRQMEKTQREYYLNEQLKAIQKELGEQEDSHDGLAELQEKIKKVKLSKEAKTKAEAELKKLRSMSPLSAEATVVRNYLDWLLSIPWRKPSRIKRDLGAAQKVLDADHYGLEKVKERIVEYLAVQQRVRKVKGPILCLVGPPGVGKTSLGKSIARATGRNFVRMSLGGVRDEAEVRGHRRTYIASMPGKVVQGMKKAKSSNPLFLLDEVDKLGSDWRGDPSSALLEVLDPEQNHTFNDHYLEVDYDLSDVMFVTTANTLRMPPALLDRMEVIRLPGYTEDEKVEIAKRHLIPKQLEENGLKKGEWSISEGGLRDLIRYYTREAGVRNLERELANLARKSLRDILMDPEIKRVGINTRNLGKYAGVRKFRFGETEEKNLVGVATGLAWTEFGGELLTIESVLVRGKGKIQKTGKLGVIMQESVQAAESYVKSRAPEFGIKPTLFEAIDMHVHVPEGATPKDGPSAGVGMVTSIVSAITGIAVRKDLAMTGEITLRGRVLPIGGLKEKLLAAFGGGIKTVLIPQDNVKDLEDVPKNIKSALEIVPVTAVDEVLERALVEPVKPIEWRPEETVAPASGPAEDRPAVTH